MVERRCGVYSSTATLAGSYGGLRCLRPVGFWMLKNAVEKRKRGSLDIRDIVLMSRRQESRHDTQIVTSSIMCHTEV
jgi:hypothetical protein